MNVAHEPTIWPRDILRTFDRSHSHLQHDTLTCQKQKKLSRESPISHSNVRHDSCYIYKHRGIHRARCVRDIWICPFVLEIMSSWQLMSSWHLRDRSWEWLIGNSRDNPISHRDLISRTQIMSSWHLDDSWVHALVIKMSRTHDLRPRCLCHSLRSWFSDVPMSHRNLTNSWFVFVILIWLNHTMYVQMPTCVCGMQHTATHCNTLQQPHTLRHTATHCNNLYVVQDGEDPQDALSS